MEKQIKEACEAALKVVDELNFLYLIVSVYSDSDEVEDEIAGVPNQLAASAQLLNKLLSDEVVHTLSLANPAAVTFDDQVAECYAELALSVAWRGLGGLPSMLEQGKVKEWLAEKQLDTQRLTVELRKEWRRASGNVVPKGQRYSKVLNQTEVGKLYGVHRGRVPGLVDGGKIDAKKYGDRSYRIAEDDIPFDIPSDSLKKRETKSD
jgi:hypothetical protein